MSEVKDEKIDVAEEKKVANKRVVVPEIVDAPQRVKDLIGRNLTLRDMDKMPTLADFRDRTVSDDVDASIRENKDIIFTSVKMSVAQWGDTTESKWRSRYLWHGRALDGRVMLLLIDDAFPSFYLRQPDDLNETEFVRKIREILSARKIYANSGLAHDIEIVRDKYKRFVFHENDPHTYAYLQFTSAKAFSEALKDFGPPSQRRYDNGKPDAPGLYLGWAANSDFAQSRLYLQMVRENDVNPGGMNAFKFKKRGNPFPNQLVSDIDEIFTVSIHDIRPWEPPATEKRESFWVPRLYNLNFDIEAGSATRGMALYAERDDTHSHVISFTMRWNRRDLLRVSLTTSQFAKPKVGYIQFICGSEIEMFLLFANLVRRLRPAIISHYNGHNFDWTFIATKLKKHNASAQFFAALDFRIADVAWLTNKCASAASCEDAIQRNYMKHGHIKISAEDLHCPIHYPDMVSFLDMDIFTRCKIKWPSSKFSEKSLNAFLAKVGEPPKYDMPAWRQFDIYETKLEVDIELRLPATDLRERKFFIKTGENEEWTDAMRAHEEDITNVNVYCVFDTISALDLCDKAGLQTEMMIAAQQYMCTPHEAIYLAKGGLVMDYVVYKGFKEGLLDGNEAKGGEGAGYPGARVIHPPIRGLSTITPNSSDRRRCDAKWKGVTDEEEQLIFTAIREAYDAPLEHPAAKQLSATKYELFHDMWSEYKQVPNVDFDFESMYPTIMAEHCSSPERIIKTVEDEKALTAAGHNVYIKDRTFPDPRTGIERHVHTALLQTKREIGPDGKEIIPGPEKRGIIPKVQQELKAKRKRIRGELAKLEAKLIELQKQNPHGDYTVMEAQCAKLNAEQLECKVCMNTMYGKMGDANNKFFRIAVSSDVTLTGQEYLREVERFLKKDCGWTRIRYGDTDSIYVDPPSEEFKEFHLLWFSGQISREEYARQMVEHAIKLGKAMSQKINAHLKKNCGSDFMNMQFEGAHFPNIFIRQKRNVTRLHGENTGFKADFDVAKNRDKGAFHITGIGWKKDKAASKLFVELSSEMIFRLLDINNTMGVAEIAEEMIATAYKKAANFEWPMNYFIQRASYKKEKQNIRVHSFVARLLREGRIPPKEYEKFEYVKVRRDDIEFDDRGCKADVSEADYMELYSYAMEHKLPINFTKYMIGEVCNELAQYMCCDSHRLVPAIAVDPDNENLVAEVSRVAEEATLDMGTKFIEDICNRCAGTLATNIKKPAYTAVRKQALAYLSKTIPQISNFTTAGNLRLIEHVRKSGGSFEMYEAQIKKDAAAGAAKVTNALKEKYCPPRDSPGAQFKSPVPTSEIISIHNRFCAKEGSPSEIYAARMAMRKDELEKQLKAECATLDAFVQWHVEYTSKIAASIRNQIGLAKPIIAEEDITRALDMLKGGSIIPKDLPEADASKIPSPEIFVRCTNIADELADIAKHIQAFESFRDYLGIVISERNGGGTSMTIEQQREDVKAGETIQTPSEAFDPVDDSVAFYGSPIGLVEGQSRKDLELSADSISIPTNAFDLPGITMQYD